MDQKWDDRTPPQKQRSREWVDNNNRKPLEMAHPFTTDLVMRAIIAVEIVRHFKDCSNTFLECSFMYSAPCKWNKISEHIRI